MKERTKWFLLMVGLIALGYANARGHGDIGLSVALFSFSGAIAFGFAIVWIADVSGY